MKISKIGSGKATERTEPKKKAPGHGREFAEHLRDAAATDEGPGVDAAGAASVGSILAVQETADTGDEPRRRQAWHYAETLLDRLEELRRDLLVGAIPKERLADIARSMRVQRQKTDDPRLNAIIDEIELRAEVEIAKYTRTL